MANSIYTRICCRCRRLIDLTELLVDEGRDYHEHCHLEIIRTRITVLDKKVQRGTATILDAKDLDDLRFLEDVGRKDIESGSGKLKLYDVDKPCFKGNTSLGLYSVMSPSKLELEKLKELKRLSCGGWKELQEKQPEFEPVFKIMTGGDGHKYCMQIGTRSIENKKELEGVEKYKNLEIPQNTSKEQKVENPSVRGLPRLVDAEGQLENPSVRG